MAGDGREEPLAPELLALFDADSQGWAFAGSVREAGRIVDFELRYVNETGARILGRAAEDLVGRRYRQLWPETVNDTTIPLYREVVERRQPLVRTVYYDRQTITGHFELRVSPYGDGFAARFVDLTRLALGQPSEAGTRLYDLLDAAFDGFTLLRAVRDEETGEYTDFVFEYVNQIGAKITGFTVEDIIGQRVRAIAPVTVASGLLDRYCEVARTGVPLQLQLGSTPTGQVWEIKAVRTEQGFVAVSYRDITTQVDQQAQIAHSAAEARRAAEIARLAADRTSALQTITAALVAASTTAEVYAAMGEVVRPSAGGRGMVVLLGEDDRLVLGYHAGYEPEVVDQLRRLSPSHPYPATEVARTGVARYVASPEEFAALQPDPATAVSGGGRRAWAFLPLTTAGHTLGALVIGYAEPHEFDAADRANLAAYSGLCAQALQRTRLFEAQASIATALQHALLPTSLPTLRGARHAVRYLPWTRGADVGGDWYDLIPLGPDTVVAVIGDVVGHNTAAAGVMGQLRSAMRAYAADGYPPTGVMRRVNQLLLDLEPAAFATCCYLELHLAEGNGTAVLAGHPPPVLRDGGDTRHLELRTGPPLGVGPDPGYLDTSFPLPAGSSLLLYTDGLIEDRRYSVDRGLAELCAAVRAAPSGDPHELIEHVLGANVGPDPRSDDVAILAMTTDGRPAAAGSEVTATRRLPGDAASVPVARRFVADLLAAWHQPGLVDDACLILNEILTNAVQHTVGDVRVVVSLGARLRIEVHDHSVRQPRVLPAQPSDETGRGLYIVDRLAAGWGVEPFAAGGKSVRFELHRRQAR